MASTRSIVYIPIDRRFEAFLEIVQRLPFQLALRKGGIDGVTAIVVETVGYVADQAFWFTELLQNQLYGFDVRPFAIAAEVINVSRLSFEKSGHDAGAMVLDVNLVGRRSPFCAVWPRTIVPAIMTLSSVRTKPRVEICKL